jgi:hypothetical protein
MTAQMAEIIIIDGEERIMTCCPRLPSAAMQIRERSDQEKQAAQSGAWHRLAKAAAGAADEESRLNSTACWRRYRATWEIIGDRLYLMHVIGRFERLGELPLFADWVTHVLRVPAGTMLHYEHMDFESVYERDLLIEVTAGRVTGWHVRDNHVERPDVSGRSFSAGPLPKSFRA